MAVYSHREHVRTRGDGDIIDITRLADNAIRKSGLTNGVVTVFVPGSTAAVTTIEFETGAVQDLRAAIERLAPKSIRYEHDQKWGDGNGYSHVRAALLKPGIGIPFSAAQLLLGTWQQLILLDFDNRPRAREIIFQVLGE
jgi:secondary thiamine-phosphate synthase enzyme